MNEIRKEIEKIEQEMKACRPGIDFPKWQELNDKKSRLENELHRMNVLARDEELHDFYAGINKARTQH